VSMMCGECLSFPCFGLRRRAGQPGHRAEHVPLTLAPKEEQANVQNGFGAVSDGDRRCISEGRGRPGAAGAMLRKSTAGRRSAAQRLVANLESHGELHWLSNSGLLRHTIGGVASSELKRDDQRIRSPMARHRHCRTTTLRAWTTGFVTFVRNCINPSRTIDRRRTSEYSSATRKSQGHRRLGKIRARSDYSSAARKCKPHKAVALWRYTRGSINNFKCDTPMIA
jgi:hypothetical protein